MGLPGTAVAGALAAGALAAGALAAGALAAGALAAGALAAGALAAGAGSEVAEDPQANSKTTNSNTIALGKCLMNFAHGLISDMLPYSLPTKRNKNLDHTNKIFFATWRNPTYGTHNL